MLVSKGTQEPEELDNTFRDHDVLTAEKLNRAFLRAPAGIVGSVRAPNWLQRVLWKALGVEWVDIRHELALKELAKLK